MSRSRVLLAAAWLLLAGEASADRRNFTFIYEPKTMARGELELEYYMTAAVRYDRLAADHDFDWSHQVELEYGITDRWDVSMYQMFGESGWSGYKLRTRYRPWDHGALPVDLLLYAEYIGLPSGEIELEERVILGRTFGKLVLSLDSMSEQGPLPGDPGFKVIEGLGIGYEISPRITTSLETQARLAWEPKEVYGQSSPELEFTGTKIYVGPTLSLATEKLWWDVNFSLRAMGEHDDARYLFRVLWGVFI